jgi:hypothetical protein
MSANIHLRGISEQLFHTLKQTASEQNISTNKLILNLLQQTLGLLPARPPRIYHDMDSLAGTWSSQEAKEFLKNTSDFEKIDEELWK